jgi:xanthine dehydrogenase accessory factor
VREVLDDILGWIAQGKAVGLATVVRTWGSAPRQPGSKMAVSEAGEMAGSVSGGCVEAAVVEEALRCLRGGSPSLLHYGVADETAWSVGLTCGGQIDVFVEPLSQWPAGDDGRSTLEVVRSSLEEERPMIRGVVVRGPASQLGRSIFLAEGGRIHGCMDPALLRHVTLHARGVLACGAAETRVYPWQGGEVEVLFDPILPPPDLVIVGAVHIAVVLTRLAKALGFRVIVLDPRRAFASAERFPDADRLVRMWPEEGLAAIGLKPTSAVAVLSHDPKLDDPALLAALRSPAGYVGALGSRESQEQRRRRLLAAGLTEEHLAKLHTPIGLDLGGDAPEEIALGILAEIVAARTGCRS